jgi:hypothetical protein
MSLEKERPRSDQRLAKTIKCCCTNFDREHIDLRYKLSGLLLLFRSDRQTVSHCGHLDSPRRHRSEVFRLVSS